MRVLMLTPALPYPTHQGGALRNFGIIRSLHDAGHQVTLLSFHDNSPVSASLSNYCDRVETVKPPRRKPADRLHDLLLTRQPDIARRLESDDFRQCLQSLSQRFDLVQFEGLEIAAFLPLIRQRQPQAKLCYDAHNAEYALQRDIFHVDRRDPRRLPAALYSFVQVQRITAFERSICQQADSVIAVSDEDAEALRGFRRDGKIGVISNGIFTDEYAMERQRLDLGEDVIVFTGKMDYRPNVDAMLWFTSDVLPLVHKTTPNARLYVVGQKPHPRLEKLREKEFVEVTGWVAEVQPYLHAAGVYIAPLRMGSGTRLKILEAMAAGCAVVATSAAISGLSADVRQAIKVADSASEFAAAVVSLLQDSAQRQRLGDAARVFVRRHYDWSVLAPTLLSLYREIGLE